jgi:hypothetical protein
MPILCSLTALPLHHLTQATNVHETRKLCEWQGRTELRRWAPLSTNVHESRALDNHCKWFQGPLCEDCHQLLHARATQAGIDLRNTNDPIMRIQQGLSMLKIGEYMLLEQLKQEREKEVQSQRGEQS